MKNIVIFGGTTEGRELAEWCDKNRIKAYVSVTTEYGAHLLPDSENVVISDKKMTEKEILEFVENVGADIIVDATHPYAKEVTKNIKNAVNLYGTDKADYYRVVRENDECVDGAEYFDNIDEAVRFLDKTDGNIFVTTGSKELKKICGLSDYKKRCAVRVLDSEDVIRQCHELGFDDERIIADRGPFSVDDNIEQLKKYKASYMITKESGMTGGFKAKADAAETCGVKMIIVRRPLESGVTVKEMENILSEKKIIIAGIGMDGQKSLTNDVENAINEAEVIIGAGRMTRSVSGKISGKDVFVSYKSNDIADFINKSEKKSFVILMSGDTGFFSGTKSLLPLLKGYDTEVMSGIASPVYFAAKTGMTWQDMHFVSLHGNDANIIRNVCSNEKTFFLLGWDVTPADICTKLTEYGMGNVEVYIGENLSMENEKIYEGTAKEYTDIVTDRLCVMTVVNNEYEKCVRSGIPDDEFIRGKVPMTKSEIRSVCISLMNISKRDNCWDIGCGTGSVSVEMAIRCADGRVTAIDKNKEAIELTDKNRHKFGCDNIEILYGDAAEKISGLEKPDVVFIGGSGGRLEQIIKCAYEKNHDVKIVVTAVSIETLNSVVNIFNSCNVQYNISQIAVTRTRKIGTHTMFAAENPIFIINTQ